MTLIEILENCEEALNVSQVAELLGVSPKKIYRLAAAGVLPSFRVGSAVRFDAQDMADWLRKSRPSDEQSAPKKRARSTRSDRSRPQDVPDHIWRRKVHSLEKALAIEDVSDGNCARNS